MKFKLKDAAGEGARCRVDPLAESDEHPTQLQVTDRVNVFLHSGSIDTGTATIDVDRAFTFPSDPGIQYIEVPVTLPYHAITTNMFGAIEVTLTRKSVMKDETGPVVIDGMTAKGSQVNVVHTHHLLVAGNLTLAGQISVSKHVLNPGSGAFQ